MKARSILSACFLACLASCMDETSLVGPAGDEVVLAPRLTGTSAIHGAFVHVSLARGADTVMTRDVEYAPGQHLDLGTVKVGDAFTIRASGYDTVEESRLLTWSASYSGTASAGTNQILGVDLPVTSAPSPVLDSVTNPDAVKVREGSRYAYLQDPRQYSALEATSDLWLPRAGLRVVYSSVTKEGTVWSPIVAWDLAASSLVGSWWEVDTNDLGQRTSVYHIILNANGKYSYIYCDPVTLDSSGYSTYTGNWNLKGNVLTYGATVVALKLDQWKDGRLPLDWDGITGYMTRTAPLPDYMAPLLGTWWQVFHKDTTDQAGDSIRIPMLQEQLLRSDSTTTVWSRIKGDVVLDTVAYPWSASASKITITIGGTTGSFGYTLEGSLLSTAPGDTMSRSRPSLMDAALLGTWSDSSGTLVVTEDGVTFDNGTLSLSETCSARANTLFCFETNGIAAFAYVAQENALSIFDRTFTRQ